MGLPPMGQASPWQARRLMLFIPIGVIFVGYTIAYYGVSQVNGGNWGLVDLLMPNRWTAQIAKTPQDGS